MANPTDWGAVPVEEKKPAASDPAAWGAVPVEATAGAKVVPGPKENPEGETISSMDTSKAQGFSQGTPLEAARDLIHGKRWDEVLKAFSPSTIFAAIAPLSTGNPRARQEIIVQQVPGAKAVDDKNGNPMIELEGKRYYTEGGDVDVGRAGLAVAGTLPLVLAAPASVPGGALLAGGTMAGQSLAEDAVARAAGGKSQEIDAGKAIVSGIAGILVPLGLGEVALPLAGRLYAAVKSGVPLTDKALQSLGLTTDQISSLTPELRQTIESVGRRTFGNSEAVRSTYRGKLANEFDVGLTRGEISGDPAQIHKEQVLASPGALPGSGVSQKVIVNNRAAQNEQLSAAQEALRTQAGGGPPLRPEDAGRVLKQGYEAADKEAKAGVNTAYDLARDPAAVEAAGGSMALPATHASQLGTATRETLAADQGVGPLALGDQAGRLTPNAKAALEEIDKFSQRAVGAKTDLAKTTGTTGTVYDPQGGLLQGPPGTTATRFAMDQPGTVTTFPDLTWKQAENLRQTLVGLQKNAAAAAAAPGGTQQDLAAMQKILAAFDDHLGPLNPLYAPARAAHEARMSTFKPGGSADQDKATRTALDLMQGPEGGTKVANTIFGSAMKDGTAGQMIDHLNLNVFPNQPMAREVLKEQALRRLVVDKDGGVLSPQKTATALQDALHGDLERPLYEKLFSPDELSRLQRFLELQKTIAASRTPINPPGSGTMVVDAIKHLVGGGIGGAIGAKIGAMTGIPGATEAGMYAGAAIGTIARNVGQRIQAARAVNPPANYGVQGLLGKPATVGGLAAGQAVQQNPGPADRLMQNAYGLLTP